MKRFIAVFCVAMLLCMAISPAWASSHSATLEPDYFLEEVASYLDIDATYTTTVRMDTMVNYPTFIAGVADDGTVVIAVVPKSSKIATCYVVSNTISAAQLMIGIMVRYLQGGSVIANFVWYESDATVSCTTNTTSDTLDFTNFLVQYIALTVYSYTSSSGTM